jgi:hypothetical protein
MNIKENSILRRNKFKNNIVDHEDECGYLLKQISVLPLTIGRDL